MTLTIKKNSKNDNFEVFFNNINVGISDYDWSPEFENHITFNTEILNLSSKYKIRELFSDKSFSFNIDIITTEFKSLDWIDKNQSTIWFSNIDESFINIYPNFLEWNYSLSPLKLIDKLYEALKNENIKTNFNSDLIEHGLYISFKTNSENSILEEYNRILSIVDKEIEKIFDIFNMSNERELISIFTFPNEIRQACEQYLIYFSKFLEDIGIESTSKLESQNKTTFFTITPTDSKEALSNIKNLLDIYLTMPETENFDIVTNDIDVSVHQLISNIYHLKSQLALAKSIIQNNEATIESLKFTNYQKSLFIDSKNKPNEEKTLSGLITIGEYEGQGFKINFAEIYRRLKRKFKKN